MKPFDILNEILGHPVKIKVLRHLLLGFETHTGRDLASMAKVSQPAVLKPLQDLVSQGILRKTVVGKSYIYQINKNNRVVAQGLIPLFRLEAKLLDLFGKELQGALPKNIDTAIWFGSVARGTATEQSDWDILLLCPDKKTIQKAQAVIDDKGVEWSVQYSTHLDIQARETQKFRQQFRSGRSFAKNVYEDYIHSKVPNPLFGESLTIILGGRNG